MLQIRHSSLQTLISIVGFLMVCTFSDIYCQENAQLRVPKSLEECYRNDTILQRDNRLPMTMTTLIELIRKIENTPGFNQDILQLTTSLLHRFRQDGIQQAIGVEKSDAVLPFSPSGFQFSKHRILLSRLIPGNAYQFPNETLTAIERCSLHFMLSSTFEKRMRGDEQQRCNKLSQYRASMRIPRDIEKTSKHTRSGNNFIGDVEMIEAIEAKIKTKPSNGKFQTIKSNFDGEYETPYYGDVDGNFGRDYDISNEAVSQCPVESGVVWTPWGTVSAGTLIAGIAAGLVPQRVQLRTLLALARRPGNVARQYNVVVDNKWAATLAGDLAEVALIQAPLASHSDISVGAAGGWNSTAAPKWYFLTQKERLEMTDAEIRGGIDGLILANKISEWRSKTSNLKLSQLLDMYYSHAGVLDSGIKACDRKKYFTDVVAIDELKAQAFAFSIVLDREIQLQVTLEEEGIRNFASRAVDALSTYITQSLNDLSCAATSAIPNDQTIWKTASDLYIFIDTSWQFLDINPIVSYILDRVDIGKYGTHVTIMNANDCKFITNTTDSKSNVDQTWNIAMHRNHPTGFNLPQILRTIHKDTTNLMDEEKRNSSSGGRSLIALIIPNLSGVNDADTNYALQQKRILSEEVPDLKILFMANGSPSRFSQFVTEESKDLFSIRPNVENVATQAKPVIQRIREIPRRIINHRCGSMWQSNEYGTSQMNQYVSPGSANFYRLHPNYFFVSSQNRMLRVQGQGLTVCSSRQVQLPRMNSTQKDNIDCRQLVSDTYEVNLNNACNDYSYINECPPLYISAEVSRTAGSLSGNRCTDPECERPDQIKFTIQHENLGCFSGCNKNILCSTILILSLLFQIILRR